MKTLVVVPWHNPEQLAKFRDEWDDDGIGDYRVIYQQDKTKAGCASTKNAGIQEAMSRGADAVVILDDDCFPTSEAPTLNTLIRKHEECLCADTGDLFLKVTTPPNRGTPYFNSSHPTKKVAASIGFWTNVPDQDACGQLVRGGNVEMTFRREIVRHQYFAMSGMNIAFWLKWWPFCQFQPHERFDDIFQGFIFQRRAYSEGYCFNLGGPLVKHSRQSNIWSNLRAEAKYIEANETVWQKIAESPSSEYEDLVKLLPPV